MDDLSFQAYSKQYHFPDWTRRMQKTNHSDKYFQFLQALLNHTSVLVILSIPFSNVLVLSKQHSFDCSVYQTMRNVSVPHIL